MKRKKVLIPLIMLMPFLLGIIVFYCVPFIIGIYYSLTSGNAEKELVGFKNYLDLFSNDAFLLAFKNTIIFICIAVPLILIISFSIAMLINEKVKGIKFFRTTFTLPLVIPIVSIVLFWQIIFADNGMINSILNSLGFDNVNWMKSQFSILILIALYIWKNASYNIILFLVGLNNIPKSYYEAAELDGCGKWKKITGITLPLLIPTIMLNSILAIANCFKVYREAYILCGDYPPKSMYMIQHFMNNNFQNFNYQRLSTASIIVFLFISILIYLVLMYQRKREV